MFQSGRFTTENNREFPSPAKSVFIRVHPSFNPLR